MRPCRAPNLVAAIALLSLAFVAATPQAEAKNVTFVLEMKEFVFSPDFLRVEPGDDVTLIVFNNETGSGHTFDLDEYDVHLGTTSEPILPGQNRSATFTADRAGVFHFYCSIQGHATNQGGGRWTGMAGRFQVGNTPPSGDSTAVIAGGLIILGASLAAIAYFVRRKKSA